jgi:hypothetical protein
MASEDPVVLSFLPHWTTTKLACLAASRKRGRCLCDANDLLKMCEKLIFSSCYACGKIKRDIGKALLECGRCKMAFYCDKACAMIGRKAGLPLTFSRIASESTGVRTSRHVSRQRNAFHSMCEHVGTEFRPFEANM